MKIEHALPIKTLVYLPTVLLLVSIACGTSSNRIISTIDPGTIQTEIAGTAYQAELQTLGANTLTNTLIPTKTTEPSITPEPLNSPIPIFSTTPTDTPIPTPEPTNLQIVITGSLIRIKAVDKKAEYVDLENIGDLPQDLSGWTLVSEKGNQACELNGIIPPGETLRVWAGNPDGGGYNCQYAGYIWNNDELDPAVLYNDQGQEVARYP